MVISFHHGEDVYLWAANLRPFWDFLDDQFSKFSSTMVKKLQEVQNTFTCIILTCIG